MLAIVASPHAATASRRKGAGRPKGTLRGRTPRETIAIAPDRKRLLGEIAEAMGWTMVDAAGRAVTALATQHLDELRAVMREQKSTEQA